MLEKAYNAQIFEKDIYTLWEKEGVFQPKANNKKETHINILPPPNANGSLHLGHASGYTIMDIAGRFARMQGKETLLLPGKDHAGILTQTVFEKKLLKEQGIDKHALGRKQFHKECYDFCTESAEVMRAQEKRIGLSADWEREKFTLDPKISKEVLKTFVKMYDEGIIYKGSRIINWCPKCQTALSDMEVEHKNSEGFIWDLHYPLSDGSAEIIVATTRPETMLGDSAVAVHPDDTRYAKFIGKTITLPITNRKIPIVSDSEISMEFGSGAVKITPAHDPLDYAIGKRNNLEEIQVIGFDGKMNKAAGKDFEGMTTQEARKKIIDIFQELKLLGKKKKHVKPLSLHDRCGYTIEPLISMQWWMNTNHEKFSLQNEALKAVKTGKINIIPQNFEKTFFHWMENLQDWCISRQLWWGHQIPAWYKDDTMKVQIESPGEGWIQDTDSLDTWFSSGQWAHNSVQPFGDEQYFPGDLMVMGRDLIFFWNCRMIMMSLYHTNGTTVPYKNLYFTGLIQDKKGKKMSKSKGNGIDPLEMAEKYGTDALRLSLFIGSTPGNDMRLYEEKIEGYRNFVNKLWNAARFIQMNIHESDQQSNIPLNETDRWITSRVNSLIKDTTESLENYKYSEAGQKLYDFIWNEFCDWYLELSKGEKQNHMVLRDVFGTLLKLLHPFIPFVTEVLWKELFHTQDNNMTLLALSSWPKYDKNKQCSVSEDNITFLIKTISEIRSRRAEAKINVTKKIDAQFISTENEKDIIIKYTNEIIQIARLNTLESLNNQPLPNNTIQAIISKNTTVHLIETIDEAELEKRSKKELELAQKQLENINKRLSNQGYMNKAPAHLIQQTKNEKNELEEKIKKLYSNTL